MSGKERFEQQGFSSRPAERYSRPNTMHKPREFPPHRTGFVSKEEARYEELERQRLRERERRDRERDPVHTAVHNHEPRQKDFIPPKRRREDRDMDGQMGDNRLEGRQRMRDERKEPKRDHQQKDQSRASGSVDAGNRVLISSLPPSMSERKLKQLMQSVGEVENLKLSTTRHKALVAFTRSSNAVACRKKFHKYVLDDCKLLVEFA